MGGGEGRVLQGVFYVIQRLIKNLFREVGNYPTYEPVRHEPVYRTKPVSSVLNRFLP